ncbi:flagellar basal body L-ring protein FlgH [Janthinobacterium fluminis]|uniref:Flagellar L-ring protein n=1 Tax=Janthinobacterium fluminis TaxID=2987524 RepID=A0ABT5K2W7_9BURK|nr:flagellar basal body L-ring protein FlgH [Janthinobacterium fluminis]MDC8759323.1 flagellar basal body L-ring protein FlgH [Janthinobacterium fluminis]
MKHSISLLILAAALGGCAVVPTSIVQHPTSSRPLAMELPPASNGAIFQSAAYRPFFEDRRARQVGDMLTITITEKTNAVKAGASSGNKSGSVNFGMAGPLQSRFGATATAEGATKYADGANQSASNAFTGTIGVTVVEVLPNGNLIVAGEKQVAMNKGVEFIRFSGMVSPDTIATGNQVLSTQVADARVEYRTNSQVDRAEMASMASRFFLSLLPF